MKGSDVKNRILGLLAAMALAFGAGAFIASPAYAAKADCPWGYFCLWTNANYGGTMTTSLQDQAACRNLGIGNRDSSVFNNRPTNTYIFKGRNCGGGGWLVNAGQSYATMPSGFDNNVESLDGSR